MPFSRGSSDPGIEPTSVMSPALAGGFLPPGKPGLYGSSTFNSMSTLNIVMHSGFTHLTLFQTECAAAAKSLQSCPTLCDPIDGSLPGSPVPGIFQARTLEWVAISFSNAWKWKMKVTLLSRVQLFVTPRTAAYQAPPSMGFSRQEYWSGVPLPSLIKYRVPFFACTFLKHFLFFNIAIMKYVRWEFIVILMDISPVMVLISFFIIPFGHLSTLEKYLLSH